MAQRRNRSRHVPSQRHLLGQPELDKTVPGTSASILSRVQGLWSDGTRLVAADNNRVLVWNAIPTTDFAPADVVLGQQSFVASAPNIGGVSASTLWGPRGLDSDGTRLIAVNETGDSRKAASGGVSSFRVDPKSGALTLVNTRPSGGPAPCHLALDAGGRHVVVSNYYGGNLSVIPIGDGGTLVYEPCAVAWHQHRQTMTLLRRQMFDYGYGFTAFAAKHSRDLELGNLSTRMVRRWANLWGRKRLRQNFKLALRRKGHFPIHLILLEILGGIMGWRVR